MDRELGTERGVLKRGRPVLLAALGPSSSVLPRSDPSKVMAAWSRWLIDGGSVRDTCRRTLRASSTAVPSKTRARRAMRTASLRRSPATRAVSPLSNATRRNGARGAELQENRATQKRRIGERCASRRSDGAPRWHTGCEGHLSVSKRRDGLSCNRPPRGARPARGAQYFDFHGHLAWPEHQFAGRRRSDDRHPGW
jgi:hypothetical protein